MELDIIHKDNLYPILLKFYDGLQYSCYYSFCVVTDTPDFIINSNNKIVFFKNIDNANTFLKYLNLEISFSKKELLENIIICDVQEVLLQIIHSDAVKNSWLLDAFNLLLDCMNSVYQNEHETYKKILYAYADFLTFDLSYTDFFTKYYSREELLNAFYWLLGFITSKMITVKL